MQVTGTAKASCSSRSNARNSIIITVIISINKSEILSNEAYDGVIWSHKDKKAMIWNGRRWAERSLPSPCFPTVDSGWLPVSQTYLPNKNEFLLWTKLNYSLLEWLLPQEQGNQGTLLTMSILKSAHLNDYYFLLYFKSSIFPIQVKRSII